MTRKIHDTDYLFLTTRVRALEGCLLNRGQMEQMLEAGSPEEAARILTDCGYPELETVSAITVGEMLNRERERLFQDLAELVPDPAILAVFRRSSWSLRCGRERFRICRRSWERP